MVSLQTLGRWIGFDLRNSKQRLPPAPGVLHRREHLTLGFETGVGPAAASRPVLAWCSQYRSDMDQLRWPKLVPQQTWQRLVLVTADGRRGVAKYRDRPLAAARRLRPHRPLRPIAASASAARRK